MSTEPPTPAPEPPKNRWNPKVSPLLAVGLVIGASFFVYDIYSGISKGLNHEFGWEEFNRDVLPKLQARLPKSVDQYTSWVEVKPDVAAKEIVYRYVVSDEFIHSVQPEQLEAFKVTVDQSTRDRLVKTNDAFTQFLFRNHVKLHLRYEDGAGKKVCEFVIDPEKR